MFKTVKNDLLVENHFRKPLILYCLALRQAEDSRATFSTNQQHFLVARFTVPLKALDKISEIFVSTFI